MSLPYNTSTLHNVPSMLTSQSVASMLASGITNGTPMLQGYWPPMFQQLSHSNSQVPSIGNTNTAGYINPSLLDHQQGQEQMSSNMVQHSYSAAVAGPSIVPTDDLLGIDFETGIHSFDGYPALPPCPPLNSDSFYPFHTPPFASPYDYYPQDAALYTQPSFSASPTLSTSPTSQIGHSIPMAPTISPPIPFPSTSQLGPHTQGTSTAFSPLPVSPSSQNGLDSFMTSGAITTLGLTDQQPTTLCATDDLVYLQGLMGLNSTPPSNVDPNINLDAIFALQSTFGDSTSPLFGGELGPVPQDRIPVPQGQQQSTAQDDHFPSLGIPQNDLSRASTSNWFLDHLNVPPLDALNPAGDSIAPVVDGGRSSAVPRRQGKPDVVDELLALIGEAQEESGMLGPSTASSHQGEDGGKVFRFVTVSMESGSCARKRSRDAHDSEDGRQVKRSRSASDGVNTGNPSQKAIQLSHVLPRGDGKAISRRRRVERESADTHGPKDIQQISAPPSNQAGAPTQSTLRPVQAVKAKERAIIQAAIGSPAPDLRSFIEGERRSLEEIRKEIYRNRQICRHTHDGKEYCGMTFQNTKDPKVGSECTRHYTDHHRDCCNPEPGKKEVVCRQAGCTDKHRLVNRDTHIQSKLHAIADLRFLRHVCPGCRKTIKFIPGTSWYKNALKAHNKCERKDEGVIWEVVDEEPDMDELYLCIAFMFCSVLGF